MDNIIKKVEKISFLYAILISLHEDKTNGGDVMDQYLMVSSVVIFVENRLQSGFEYTELEKAIGFSLPHIRAVFARLTGKSLSRYVLSRRIANAAFEITHSEKNILDIATKYGFSNPDSFTRAFRRITGNNPNDFRKQRQSVGRIILSAGVFGVSVKPDNNFKNTTERIVSMNNNDQKRISDGSVVLYGVPKVHYGAFGGITPLPVCMKAAANYMGIELDYAEAIVYCGIVDRIVIASLPRFHGEEIKIIRCKQKMAQKTLAAVLGVSMLNRTSLLRENLTS